MNALEPNERSLRTRRCTFDRALKDRRDQGRLNGIADLKVAIEEGVVLPIRLKAMTVATIFAGLLPIMPLGGIGSEFMRSIATAMVGGMIPSPLLSLFVIPAIYLSWRHREASAQPKRS